ncbi:MAG: pyridoxamine 5'-phosphate oxidase family protein [Propionibacteriaceae bacterium]|nr:pyridoxamine 5'-phosphate oxidase family protein [Propionibacteriaceae bacterium]
MTTPHESVRELDEAQTWQFLADHRVGRLALVIAGEPDIFPVNYVVDDRSILFRTAEGSKLLAVSLGARMAFQVDEWDHTGAVSVLAHGVARELTDAERDAATELGLSPWVPTQKEHWVRIEVDEIAGRAFTFGPEPEPYHPVG